MAWFRGIAGCVMLLAGASAHATTILNETFEGEFPSVNWAVAGFPSWGTVSYRAATGAKSAYCAGTPVAPPGPYFSDMNAWAMYGPFSLADATSGNATFKMWLKASDNDNLQWLVYVSEGERWSFGPAEFGDQSASGWQTMTADFANLPDLGNICGQADVYFCIVFWSDSSGVDEGAYVDDVVITIDDTPQPDLVIESMTHSPTDPTPSQTVTFTVTVRNQGTAAAGLFQVGFWAHSACPPSVSTPPDATQDISGLGAGATAERDFTAVAGPNGIYTAWAYAGNQDGVGEVAESKEWNNAGPSGGHSWAVGGGTPQPDLHDDGVDWHEAGPTTTVSEGLEFGMGLDVRSSSAASGAHVTQFYFSTDTAISATDFLIGTYSSSGIASGQYETQYTTLTWPPTSGPPAGTYYLGAIIDATDTVGESNESNNTVLLFNGTTTVTVVGTSSPTIECSVNQCFNNV